jgi:hypothetical protein
MDSKNAKICVLESDEAMSSEIDKTNAVDPSEAKGDWAKAVIPNILYKN